MEADRFKLENPCKSVWPDATPSGEALHPVEDLGMQKPSQCLIRVTPQPPSTKTLATWQICKADVDETARDGKVVATGIRQLVNRVSEDEMATGPYSHESEQEPANQDSVVHAVFGAVFKSTGKSESVSTDNVQTESSSTSQLPPQPVVKDSNCTVFHCAPLEEATAVESEIQQGTSEPLNRALQAAVRNNNATECRRLIAMNADPGAKDDDGQTAVDVAINRGQWLACKALIDSGAVLSSKNEKAIRRYLQSKTMKLGDSDQELFLKPCPQPYVPEVFFNGKFHPLREVSDKLNMDGSQGIALFNIGDEPLGPAYGMVMGTYRKTEGTTESFKRLAEKQIVIRVRVDDFSKLGSTVRKIREVLPNVPVTSWILAGHGNPNAVEVGPGSLLTRDGGTAIMQEVASYIDPQGSIILQACSTARDSDNIAQVFSQNAPGLLVFASPADVTSTGFSTVSSPSSLPRIYPVYMTKARGQFRDQLKVYKGGVVEIAANYNWSDDYSKSLETEVINLMHTQQTAVTILT